FATVRFHSCVYVGYWCRGAHDWNETLVFIGMGAVIAAGSGLITPGSGASHCVPAVKVVVASRFGPGCPSPARPCPTNPGCMIPYPARTTKPPRGFHAIPIRGSN